jgi:hypothetical protein
VWARAGAISGWLHHDQACALWQAAHEAPPGGTIVEIGSHQGRSTLVLAAAACQVGARVVAIDPFVEGRMFGGAATRTQFEANLNAAGLRDAVQLIAERSTTIRPQWTEPIDMLYIDGKHDYWTVRDDLRWAAHVPPGGTVLVHDAFSSVGVTLALLRHVLAGSQLRYLRRTGSLARFEAARPAAGDRARMLAELPWWLRNLVIKVALRTARMFGHRAMPDPY